MGKGKERREKRTEGSNVRGLERKSGKERKREEEGPKGAKVA